MNAKLLIPVGILAFFLMGGKKSKKTSSSQPVDDVPIDDIDDVDNKNNVPKKDTYKQLNSSRLKTVKELLGKLPMITLSIPKPYNNYEEWKKMFGNQGISYTYQDWLTNQIYWQISFDENKTDLFDSPDEFTQFKNIHTLPFLLNQGEKGWFEDPDNNIFKIVKFDETKEQAKKRLGSGEALWLDIRKYIQNNLNKCPPGAYCGF